MSHWGRRRVKRKEWDYILPCFRCGAGEGASLPRLGQSWRDLSTVDTDDITVLLHHLSCCSHLFSFSLSLFLSLSISLSLSASFSIFNSVYLSSFERCGMAQIEKATLQMRRGTRGPEVILAGPSEQRDEEELEDTV